jgi:hypothetical protein
VSGAGFYAVLRNGRTFGLCPRAFTACHRSHFACSVSQTLSSIEAGAAKILIDPFLSDNPSWDKGWIGSRAGEDSTQGGVR